MNEPIYAVGDIHGELELLTEAIAKIDADGGRDARVVFVGDYVDRGARSKEVIDFLITGLSAGRNWQCLLGNHDRMFALFMEESPQADVRLPPQYHWLHPRIGGKATLASYGVDRVDSNDILDIHRRARTLVPESHIQFLQTLDYSRLEGDLLFVHAGIRPGVPFEQQDRDDLIRIREEFLGDARSHPWLVVHGHTPVPAARHHGNRVCIDTGCGYGNQLTTAVFEGSDCWLLGSDGRVPLKPD